MIYLARAVVACVLLLTPALLEAQGRPVEPYVERGLCPLECCVYREWSANGPIPAYAAERETGRVAFRIEEGERFHALTGNVHLERVGVVVVTKPVRSAPPLGSLLPGDTVYVLGYHGEDHFGIWARGETVIDYGFWVSEEEYDPGDERHRGILVVPDEPHWWVKIRNAQGQEGWIHMNESEEYVGHKDACSVD